jgi:hypothetical protein
MTDVLRFKASPSPPSTPLQGTAILLLLAPYVNLTLTTADT